MTVKFIMEYRYESDDEWRFEDEFACGSDVHRALTEHVEQWKHIEVRVRKIKTVTTEEEVGRYRPIRAEDYE